MQSLGKEIDADYLLLIDGNQNRTVIVKVCHATKAPGDHQSSHSELSMGISSILDVIWLSLADDLLQAADDS
jgi:hypothetical protein